MEEYARPRPAAFGYVFGLMARLPGLEMRRETLTRLGEHVGAAIIAFDCAVDWRKDQRRSDFNPLPDGETSVVAALAYCRQRLSRAAGECRQAFGENARTAHALLGVCGRIPSRCRVGACAQIQAGTNRRLHPLGLAREKA